MDSYEDWTTAHNLAVLYIGLAYGTDQELSDSELETLTEVLHPWTSISDSSQVETVVMEAATAFLEGNAREEVQMAIQNLGGELNPEERRQTLRDLIEIAEADGVLLEREMGLIHTLAENWSLKRLTEELVADTSAVVQRRGEDWGLIHELAFLYILVAHSAEDELTSDKLDVMQDRLGEWQPTLPEGKVREVVRRALQVYADQPEEELIYDSLDALKQALPPIQRLTVLDDLNTIVRADGSFTENERQLIMSLAQAWDVNIRLNGHRG